FSSSKNITTMAVGNLPAAIPREASTFFAESLYNSVLPALLGVGDNKIIKRATILENGQLTSQFLYLYDYLIK
ncbi:MAG: alanine dehydrogenase, partial [Prolixibacteraceae bacterium]|nr:alanine dehydrogenase [Prolixibacteraceae bacterium]